MPECPTCGEKFDSDRGVKIHHTHSHNQRLDTDEDLLSHLKSLRDELGRPPTAEQMRENGDHSPGTYSRRFGSWNEALAEAGIESNKQYKIPKEDLIAELKRLDEIVDGTLQTSDMKCRGSYCVNAYRTEFGSWTEALVAAGLVPDRFIPKEVLISRLRDFADGLGRTPTAIEMYKLGPHSPSIFRDRWRSWNAALREAGLELNQRSTVFVECDSCGDEVEKMPSQLDRHDRHFCDSACCGDWLSQEYRGEGHPNWEEDVIQHYGPDWEQTRQEVLNRDGFECQDCGISEKAHLDEFDRSLAVHHIRPRSAFISDDGADWDRANRPSNLITLCVSCHPKWEKMSPLRPDTARV